MDMGKTRLMRTRLLMGAAAVALMTTASAHAQSYRFTSFDVQGNQRIEDATILSYLGLTPGQNVSAGRVNDGYQRLLNSGLFESVEIVPSGNQLVVIVTEFPTISRINFEGNNRLKDEVLAGIVQSQVRRVFNPATAEADAAAIVAAYEASGRLAAVVSPRIIRRSDNRVDLVFEIAEGRVTEVERVSFVGNRAYSDRRLRRVLETKQAGIFRALIGSDTFINDRIAFDVQLLRDFYASRGYIDAQVLSATPELSPTRDAFFLTFRVQEGQQYRFANIEVTSDLSEIDVDLYQAEVRPEPGDIYNPATVDRMVERLELLATRAGLNFIRVTPRVIRNDADLTLDIELVVERGPRVFVERIDIEGNATTLDRVIRAQFDTVEGDPFNPREIRAAAERIRALGYFANADVGARPGSSESQVIVDVDVTEQPTGSLGFGLNYSEQNGAGIAITFAEENFLGRGQAVKFSIDTTSDSRNSILSFAEPRFLSRDLEFSFVVSHATTSGQDASYDTENAGIRLGLGFPTGEFSRLSVFAGAHFDKLQAVPATTSQILTLEPTRATTASVGYGWSYDTRGVGLDPSRGIKLTFGQEYAGLGGDVDYLKTVFSATAEREVYNEEVRLIAAIEGGNLTTLGGGVSRQANRFFNSQSQIRGFEALGIGPRDLNAGSDPLGGNNYFAARLETQFPLTFLPDEYGMSGALFADAASVWGLDNTNGGVAGGSPVDDSMHVRTSVGFGLLWTTQIGPLRFNFTRAISSQSYDKEQSFDLTIQAQF